MESENLNLPNSIKICEYFNEIGLIDYDNVNSFLNIYTDVIKNSEKKEENEYLKVSLFSYFKLILEDDKNLFDYIKRIINSFNNHKLICKYKALKDFKSLFCFKLRNIFNLFFFKLVLKVNENEKKKHLFKTKRNNNKKSNTIYKKQFLQNLDFENLEISENKNRNSSYGNINFTQKTKLENNFINNFNNTQTSKANSERPFSYKIDNKNIEKNIEKNLEKELENYLEKYSEKKIENNKKRENIKNDKNINYNNIQSYTIYAPALQIQPKIPIKNLDYPNLKSPNSNSNITSTLDFNNESNINSNQKKISSPFLTNKTFNTINNSSYDFYGNETKHLEKINEKIINMKINRINEIEQNCTFKPKINNYKSKKKNNNSVNKNNNNQPRYIQLNNDAKIRKENLDNLKLQYLNDELEKEYLLNPNNKNKKINDPLYYEKLYNDAKILKKKNLDNLRKANEEYSFAPEIKENKDYIVSMNFSQRNNQFLENKKRILSIKEEKENEYIEKINQNLRNVNSNEVVDRLYKKEMEKINLKKQKENEEEEKKNKKINPINWDKLFKENNFKYTDGIYYKKKKFKEEEKFISNGLKKNSFQDLNENNIEENIQNLKNTINQQNKNGIQISLTNNNIEYNNNNNNNNNININNNNNNIYNNINNNNSNNNNNNNNNNINNNNNNNIIDDKNKEENYKLNYELLEKIKNEKEINFKKPNENNEKKKFLDIQSLSDVSQNNINDKNTSMELYVSPNTNINDLLSSNTENSNNKHFLENNILDSMKSNALKELFEDK